MEQYGWILWAVLMVVFAIVEAATVNLVSIWVVGGALSALIVQLLGGSIWLQLAGLRPFVRRYVAPRRTATNADMVLGREAFVLETVDNLHGTGSLKLDGKVWTARSATDAVLPEGMLVKVVKLEGVKLYVEPVHAAAGV